MSSFSVLPPDYRVLTVIDLEKDKKAFWFVNILSLIIALVLLVIGLFVSPLEFETDADNYLTDWILPSVVLLAGMFLYILLHEAVHGVFMYAFSRIRPRFGFRSVFAYAGSDAFFDKAQYFVIALAPVVIWGILLLVVCFFLSGNWFWTAYVIQILNIGGAAGDFYVSVKLSGYPKDILIQDTGTRMTVFARMREESQNVAQRATEENAEPDAENATEEEK